MCFVCHAAGTWERVFLEEVCSEECFRRLSKRSILVGFHWISEDAWRCGICQVPCRFSESWAVPYPAPPGGRFVLNRFDFLCDEHVSDVVRKCWVVENLRSDPNEGRPSAETWFQVTGQDGLPPWL